MKRALASLLLLLVLVYTFHVGRSGLANTAYFQARFLLDKWQRQPQSITETSFQQAYDLSNRSVFLAPKNPHYQITKAKIVLWGFYAGFSKTEQIDELDSVYQFAIAQRPNWPEAYADYAWYLSAVKQDFAKAWTNAERAVAYGPFHGDSLETVVKVMFSRWAGLNPQQKSDAFAWIARALQTQARDRVILQVKQNQKEFAVCYYLKRKGNLAMSVWQSIEQQLCLAI